mmetsp:Transcript_37613/g.69448  ORF Transcript_37613/g.69448 Transcript_37613/m.69448 type:complete len:551 (-) Transcript_37613:143-1795(-)
MAVAATPVASDDTSRKPARRELQRRAAAPESQSRAAAPAGAKPGATRRLAAAGFTEERSADAERATLAEAIPQRRPWRCRTAPAEILKQAVAQAVAEESPPKPLRRVSSMMSALGAAGSPSSPSSPKPLRRVSLKPSSPGRRHLAATHIDIATAACAELIRLLNKRAGVADNVVESAVFQVGDERNEPAGGDMESLVQRLTEKVREAKVETMAVLEAKNRLQDFWMSQQRLWEAEKAEMIRVWAEERAELLKRVERGPARMAAASKPLAQDRGSQTEPRAGQVDITFSSESPEQHSSCSDCGGPTPRASIEAVLSAALPALSCSSSCAELAASTSEDMASASASATTPTWRIPTTATPPGELDDSNQDLQALGKHLSQRFALPGALLADIRSVLRNDGERLSKTWPRRFSTPAALGTLGPEAKITVEIFEELLEQWGATSVISSSASSLMDDLSGGTGELEVGELFSALACAFTVEPAQEIPDIDKCVEQMRATKQEKPTFQARGTVSQKAAQYELEVNRQRVAGIKRRKSMPSFGNGSQDDHQPRVTSR